MTSLRLLHLRIFGEDRSQHQARVLRTFAALAALWERRLAENWMPPDTSPFPWAQVRLSLAALLPGFAAGATAWLRCAHWEGFEGESAVVALILAGNTPLLAWSPLAAALLAGQAVFVKQSRDEIVWTRLFVESLAEVDAELAALIHLDLWPGDDPRTAALVQAADAVIAYGGDATLAALRNIVPDHIPFFGFGHTVSIGIAAPSGDAVRDQAVGRKAARGFARDILMYDQAGCLSPHVLFGVEVSELLAEALQREAEALEVPAVTDPAVAIAVRQARDMANFDGFRVTGDPSLRWTVAETESRNDSVPAPVGHGVVFVVPTSGTDSSDILERLGPLRGRVSSVGIAGEISPALRDALSADGVSRLCPPGEMQTPPLDWPNGNIDLLVELLKIRRNTDIKAVDGLSQT